MSNPPRWFGYLIHKCSSIQIFKHQVQISAAMNCIYARELETADIILGFRLPYKGICLFVLNTLRSSTIFFFFLNLQAHEDP